jgi:acetyl-CoA carboxylase biotin carboxylase subunit
MQFHLCSTEAANSFSNPDLYLEKFIIEPHHVEIQLMCDTHGNYFHFGERDCSIQRRHQKLIEETPSPLMTDELRKEIGDAAIKGAKIVNYRGAGTMEFLVDVNHNYYFMEMNTAFEVDLVKDQIKVAMGEKLNYIQEDIKHKWACIECRINAEDVEKDFRPTPGKLTGLHIPGGPGVRVDRAVYTGYSIPPYYDSMIAKLIVKGRTRQEVLQKVRIALDEFIVEGIPTTIPFHKEIFNHPDFIAGDYDIAFLESRFKSGSKPEQTKETTTNKEKE